MNDIASGKDKMTWLGFGLILVFLLLVYRKIDAATPLIPIIFIVGWNPVAMILLGINYTPITAVLGSMTIGVAAEYTILIMERYLDKREKTGDVFEAIQRSVQKMGTAITVSELATSFGFSALILSTFPIISNIGISTIVASLFSLIGAIVVMPAGLSLDRSGRVVPAEVSGLDGPAGLPITHFCLLAEVRRLVGYFNFRYDRADVISIKRKTFSGRKT